MKEDPRNQPTTALVADLLQHVERLVRGEVRLARAEVALAARRALAGVAALVMAGVLAFVGLNLLAGALVGMIVARGFSPTAAALIVALLAGAIAVILGLWGASALRASPLARTRHNLGLDAQSFTERTPNE